MGESAWAALKNCNPEFWSEVFREPEGLSIEKRASGGTRRSGEERPGKQLASSAVSFRPLGSVPACVLLRGACLGWLATGHRWQAWLVVLNVLYRSAMPCPWSQFLLSANYRLSHRPRKESAVGWRQCNSPLRPKHVFKDVLTKDGILLRSLLPISFSFS